MIYQIIILLSILVLFAKNKKSKLVLGYSLILLMAFVGAFRNIDIGTDTGTWYYSNWFFTTFELKTWNHFTPFEPGFNILMALSKYIINSYEFFYCVIFLTAIAFICISAKKIRVSIIYVFSFFFLTYCFAQSLNIVRQMFGLSIGCFLIAEFYNKKISFVIFELSICFLCYLIHHSLLILGLFPIFVYFDFNKYCSEKILILLLVLMQVLSLFFLPLLTSYLLGFTGVLDDRSNHYIEIIDEYGASSEVGWITSFVSNFVLVLLSKHNRNCFFYFAFLGTLLSILLSSFGAIGRISINLSFFSIMYLAFIWDKIKCNSYYLLLKIIYISSCVYILYGSLINNKEYNPYSTMFF